MRIMIKGGIWKNKDEILKDVVMKYGNAVLKSTLNVAEGHLYVQSDLLLRTMPPR